jgi:hypothetical protein
MSIQARTQRRKRTIIAHRARNFAEAERWDLEFWQQQSAEQRLSALVALRADLAAVSAGRKRQRP